jgi:hypothetical protein
MALAVVKDGKILELTHDAATAWTWDDATYGWPGMKFVRIDYIHWIPNAADDVICIKNQSTSGPILFYAKAADTYDQRIVYFYGASFRPVIDESTTTGVDQIVIFFAK